MPVHFAGDGGSLYHGYVLVDTTWTLDNAYKLSWAAFYELGEVVAHHQLVDVIGHIDNRR